MSTRNKIILTVAGLLFGALVLYYVVIDGPSEEPLVVETDDAPPPSLPGVDPFPAEPELVFDVGGGGVPDDLLTRSVTAAQAGTVLGSPETDVPAVGQPAPARVDPAPAASRSEPATRLAANEPVRVQTPPSPPRYTDYVVRSGDTMSSIATSWFGDEAKWTLIARANPRVDPDMIRPGDALRLPPKDGSLPPPPANVDRPLRTTYIVQRGDTLSEIAKLVYGDGNQWELIFDANRRALGNDPNRLVVGTRLVLPELRETARR